MTLAKGPLTKVLASEQPQSPGQKILTATPNLQFTPVSVTDSSIQTIHKLNYNQNSHDLLTPISEKYNEGTGVNSRRSRPANIHKDIRISEEDVEIQSVASSEHN